MNNQKQLIKATLIFSVLSILQPASNFLLLPVYTKYLSIQQYGYFSILNNIANFFTIISGLNIVTAIVAFYKSYKTQNDLKKFIGDIITFCIYFNIVLVLLLLAIGDQLFSFILKEEIHFFPDILYAVSFGLVSNIILAHFSFLKYERRLNEFAVLSIIQFIAFISLQYLFIVIFQSNIRGALEARILAAGVILIIVLYLNRNYIFRKIDYKQNIVPQLKYSIITGPAVLIGWLSIYVDRFIIANRSNDATILGQYSFLATICAIAELGIYAFNSAVQPYVFDSFVSSNKSAIRNYYKIFIGGVILIVSMLIVAGSNLHLFLKNNVYTDVLKLIPLMSVGYVFFGVSSIYSLQTTYARKSWYYLYTYTVALVVNIGLNLLLIDKFGIIGIVIASFLTKTVQAFVMVYFAQRSYKTDILKSILLISIIFTVMVFNCWLLFYYNYISLQQSVILQFIITVIIIILFIKPQNLKGFLFKRTKVM